MRPLTAIELLSACEQGLSQSPARRALTLLALTDQGVPAQDLARRSVGWRDAQLLRFRESIFGSHFSAYARCPRCGLDLEMSFTLADVQSAPLAAVQDGLDLDQYDHKVKFRLPNSQDLIDLPEEGDVSLLKRRLLRFCVLQATRNGNEVTIDELPDEVSEAIADRMSQADPQADVRLNVACPQCSHRWQSPFDIASFLWTEVQAWATRLMREIHLLASAYGWREADILSMTPWRRQAYLDLIGT